MIDSVEAKLTLKNQEQQNEESSDTRRDGRSTEERDEPSRNSLSEPTEDVSDMSADLSMLTVDPALVSAASNQIQSDFQQSEKDSSVVRNRAKSAGTNNSVGTRDSRKSNTKTRIYDAASAQALAGKQRRLEIEKASMERAAARKGEKVKKLGKLPPSKASMMYHRGVSDKKEFEEWRLKEKRDQDEKEMKHMKKYGKLSADRMCYMYDRGMEFKKKIEDMQKSSREQQEETFDKRLNPIFKGKISLDNAERTYRRLLKYKKPQFDE